MSNKKIDLQLDNPTGSTILNLENDTEQGIFHVVLRDMDIDFNEVSATGVVLDFEQLEEIFYAIGDILEHQSRADKSVRSLF